MDQIGFKNNWLAWAFLLSASVLTLQKSFAEGWNQLTAVLQQDSNQFKTHGVKIIVGHRNTNIRMRKYNTELLLKGTNNIK